MGYEIDFLAVGTGEKSGDAIAFRIWRGNYFWVFVIDGGYTDSGDALVAHINHYYGTNTINLAILTHPDEDHARGMLRVVEQMKIENLWMHRPWNHRGLGRLFQNSRVTDASVRATLRRDLDAAKDVETAALRSGVPIAEPFVNTVYNGMVYVIGPTVEFYQRQIADFRSTPIAALPPPPLRGFADLLIPRQEDWASETLDHECDTTAENNSSAILAVKFADDYWGMFTGDAGELAIVGALDWLDRCQFSTARLKFVQIPHHGSEHNASPTVLNRWLGAPQIIDRRTRTAFVSSAAAAPKHPSNRVMNAYRRRGAWPYATKGRNIWQASTNAPVRAGWVSLDPYPFYQGVV